MVNDDVVMVPKEPTEAMALAAIKASLYNPAINGVAIYRAMIAAAPAVAVHGPLPGVLDPSCNYMAPFGRVCNKCGRIHQGDKGETA